MQRIGIEEIIIIAQDTTKYGIDLYGKTKLVELLQEISQIEEIKWIRFLYAYPENITDELIQEVKNNPKICNYFDIPIQHISNNILKNMNRKSSGESIRTLLTKIRREIPNVILRTSLIVGFPGETEENFEELCSFVEKMRFDKLGAFQYSKEDGTAAARMKEQIHGGTKKRRWNKIMQLQQKISNQKMQENIDKVYEIILEGITKDGKYYFGRSYMDVPDMDGLVYCKIKEKHKIGEFIQCKIIKVAGYDLIAEEI